MGRVSVIRSFGGGLTTPLICQKPNTRGRYEDTWSCDAGDQDVYACREAMPSDTPPEYYPVQTIIGVHPQKFPWWLLAVGAIMLLS